MSDLATRTLTAIIGGALMIAGIILGREVLLAIIVFASVTGYRELAGAFGFKGEDRKISVMEVIGYLSIAAWYLILELRFLGMVETGTARLLLIGVLTGSLILHMSIYVFTYPRYDATRTIASFFSVIYCPVMLSFIYLIRCTERGHILVWMVFICSWMCDTCAYLVGMKFGRHKMSPVLSPKKSIEGAVGGVTGSVIAGCVFAAFLIAPGGELPAWQTILITGIISLFGALISMVGDLAASAIKRNHDIKDYGNLLPGHGGIMDRFDSVIFVAPIVYMLCLLIR